MRRVYQIDDMILYGGNGVCRVVDITKRVFDGREIEYYVLQPIYSDGSRIYVPKDNENLTGKMRRLLSEEEVRRLIRDMAHEDVIWIENENERKETCRAILSGGNPREVIRMIQALYRHQQEQRQKGKKLHQADERFFREAEKLLYDEFAWVLHLEPDQVLPFILEQIENETRQPA